MLRILSIDGGGVRGLVSAMVLTELERRAQRPVAKLFDLVAGTSAGAITALGLVQPDPHGGPRWRAADLEDSFERGNPVTFGRNPARLLKTLGGFLAPKYDAAPLTDQLAARFGNTMLSQALCDIIITSYDVRGRAPYFFKRADVRTGHAPDRPMKVVAAASSAAPTYFPPVHIPRRAPLDDLWLVDGGVFANNPAMCAYAEALRAVPSSEVALVSVGTGALSTNLATPRMRRAGALLWARPLFDVELDGQEDATDYQLCQLLAADRYFRFQADLPDRAHRLDDASVRNDQVLRASAKELISKESDRLDQAVRLLSSGARP